MKDREGKIQDGYRKICRRIYHRRRAYGTPVRSFSPFFPKSDKEKMGLSYLRGFLRRSGKSKRSSRHKKTYRAKGKEKGIGVVE